MRIAPSIREARIEDLFKIQQLFVETIRATCKAEYNEEQIRTWTSSVRDKDRWKGFLVNQYFLVAEQNGIILGFASLDEGNYLDFLYVHKDHQRQGIAHLLYERIRKKASSLGCLALSADVSKTALPFFSAKGFRIIRENRRLISGVELVNYKMSQ